MFGGLVGGCSNVDPGTSDTPCISNLMKLRDALSVYANKHGQRYPDTLAVLVEEGLLSEERLDCPSHSASATPGGSSYLYFGKGVSANDPGNALLVVDDTDRHRNGRLGLFTSQEVRALTSDELARLKSGGRNGE
jgi:hypothetical protein